MPLYTAGNRRGAVPYFPPAAAPAATPAAVPPAGTLWQNGGQAMTWNPQSAPGGALTPQGIMDMYTKQYNAAGAANTQRYNDILGQWNAYGQKSAADTQAQGQALLDQYHNMWTTEQSQQAQASQALAQAQQERLDRARRLVEGAGLQEGSDIRDSAAAQAAAAQQSLSDRGMGGTTISANYAMGSERAKNAELARLNERINSQKLGVESGIGGDVLQSQAQQNAQRIAAAQAYNMGGSGLMERLTGNAQANNARIMEEKLAFQNSLNQTYPDMGNYAQLMTKLGQGGIGANTPIGGGTAGGVGGGTTGNGAPSMYITNAAGRPVINQAYLDWFAKQNMGTGKNPVVGAPPGLGGAIFGG